MESADTKKMEAATLIGVRKPTGKELEVRTASADIFPFAMEKIAVLTGRRHGQHRLSDVNLDLRCGALPPDEAQYTVTSRRPKPSETTILFVESADTKKTEVATPIGVQKPTDGKPELPNVLVETSRFETAKIAALIGPRG